MDPDRHVMGLSVRKELDLLAGTLVAAFSFAPGLDLVEKVVGRHGYAHSFRTTLRAVFQAVYPWKHDGRINGMKRLPMDYDVCVELISAWQV